MISIIFIFLTIYIIYQCFKIIQIYDLKEINIEMNKIPDNNFKVNSKNYEIQHEPFINSDNFNFGLYRANFLRHSNDIDINIAGIRNGMVILDAGCGLLSTSKFILNKFRKVKVHAVTNAKENYEKEIKSIANNNTFKDRLNIHFEDYKNINILFKKKTFDKILFIESINYSNNISELLSKSSNLLKNKGQIFIKTIIIPKTENINLNKNFNNIKKKLNMNLYTHENMISLLQKSKYRNIKYSSIPFVFSENFNYPSFYLTLKKLKLLSFTNLLTSLPILIGYYIGDK